MGEKRPSAKAVNELDLDGVRANDFAGAIDGLAAAGAQFFAGAGRRVGSVAVNHVRLVFAIVLPLVLRCPSSLVFLAARRSG